jgi:hypothetical protein
VRVTSGAWTLEPNAEREILLPWLATEPDPEVRQRVERYIAGLLSDPRRPHLEDGDSGVFSLDHVPQTSVGLVWTLDVASQQVILALAG